MVNPARWGGKLERESRQLGGFVLGIADCGLRIADWEWGFLGFVFRRRDGVGGEGREVGGSLALFVEVALLVSLVDAAALLIQRGLVAVEAAFAFQAGLDAVALVGFALVAALGLAEVVEEAGQLGLEGELVGVNAR